MPHGAAKKKKDAGQGVLTVFPKPEYREELPSDPVTFGLTPGSEGQILEMAGHCGSPCVSAGLQARV